MEKRVRIGHSAARPNPVKLGKSLSFSSLCVRGCIDLEKNDECLERGSNMPPPTGSEALQPPPDTGRRPLTLPVSPGPWSHNMSRTGSKEPDRLRAILRILKKVFFFSHTRQLFGGPAGGGLVSSPNYRKSSFIDWPILEVHGQNTPRRHFPYIIHGVGATVLPDVARRRRKRDFGGAAGDISQQRRRPRPPYAAFWIAREVGHQRCRWGCQGRPYWGWYRF